MYHNLVGAEQVCTTCECTPEYMLTDCPGIVLTAYQKERVGRGRLDYIDGAFIPKITIPRFIGDFNEVNAFLLRELA